MNNFGARFGACHDTPLQLAERGYPYGIRRVCLFWARFVACHDTPLHLAIAAIPPGYAAFRPAIDDDTPGFFFVKKTAPGLHCPRAAEFTKTADYAINSASPLVLWFTACRRSFGNASCAAGTIHSLLNTQQNAAISGNTCIFKQHIPTCACV